MSPPPNLHKMLENISKNLVNLHSNCSLLNECDAANCSEEENAYRQEFEDISALNLARIELGIAEAQEFGQLVSLFGQVMERNELLEWENAKMHEQIANIEQQIYGLMAKMKGDEKEEEVEEEEEEEFKENRPPSSLTTQSELGGVVAQSELDLLFDTEEEDEEGIQSEFGATNSVISNAEQLAKIEISAKIDFCNKLFNDSTAENKTSIAAFICEKAICEIKTTGNEQKQRRNWTIFHKRLVKIYKEKHNYYPRVLECLEELRKNYEEKRQHRSLGYTMNKQAYFLTCMRKFIEAEQKCQDALKKIEGIEHLDGIRRRFEENLKHICNNPAYLENLQKMKKKYENKLGNCEADGKDRQKITMKLNKINLKIKERQQLVQQNKRMKSAKEEEEIGTSGI